MSLAGYLGCGHVPGWWIAAGVAGSGGLPEG